VYSNEDRNQNRGRSLSSIVRRDSRVAKRHAADIGGRDAHAERDTTMSGRIGSSQDVGPRPTPVPAAAPPGPSPAARRLAWAATAAIIISVLLMIAVSVVRNSWEHPYIQIPSGGLPWGLSPHLSYALISLLTWVAALLGGGGVIAGLLAASRGAWPSSRLLLVIALVAVAAMVVLLPTGSTDALDNAAYGRMAVLGHSPYLMDPYQLAQLHDPIGRNAPLAWNNQFSLYGPLATALEWAAAKLGGTSAARIIFWLKLWNAIAFVAVALVLDRWLRSDQARRARAHLLWSANPLLLWVLVAEGHVETVGAAAGLIGLMVARTASTAVRPSAARWLAAGLLVGVAVEVKITYALFALALAWAGRRWLVALGSAAAGAALAILPGYLWFGSPAVSVLFKRDQLSSIDNFYQLFAGSHGQMIPGQTLLGALLTVAVALLMLWRFPGEVPGLPAIRPALVLAVAWLLFWTYTYPWYDAMAFCLLALYPATRLDWVMLAQLTAGVFVLMPGNAGSPPGHMLTVINNDLLYQVGPALLLACAVALLLLGLTGRWKMSDLDEPPGLAGAVSER
jgi:hypothetical protein